jgi:hypothetical protein
MVTYIDLSFIDKPKKTPEIKPEYIEKIEPPIQPPIQPTFKFPKLPKQKKEKTTMKGNDRSKMEALLQLMKCEFPDKLKHHNKDFSKMSDQELLDTNKKFQQEIISTNTLGVLTESSKQLLVLYEYLMSDLAGVNIKGFSKLGDSPEYKDCVKAVLLKYMSSSLVQIVEPEYKLIYLVLSTSLVCHQLNSSQENIQPKEEIKQEIKQDEKNQVIKDLQLRNLLQDFSDL